MRAGRRVRILRNGRNEAIRISREFEPEADEAILYREDDRLIVEPLKRPAPSQPSQGWARSRPPLRRHFRTSIRTFCRWMIFPCERGATLSFQGQRRGRGSAQPSWHYNGFSMPNVRAACQSPV